MIFFFMTNLNRDGQRQTAPPFYADGAEWRAVADACATIDGRPMTGVRQLRAAAARARNAAVRIRRRADVKIRQGRHRARRASLIARGPSLGFALNPALRRSPRNRDQTRSSASPRSSRAAHRPDRRNEHREREHAGQDHQKVAALVARNAEVGEQRALAESVEADHALRPQAIDDVDAVAQFAQPVRLRPVRRIVDLRRATLDTRRTHRRGRIDALPATAVAPDFRPGVRVRLAHEQVTARVAPPAALVAGDDARGNAGRAHEEHERGRVVLAEALARVEQEFVDGIAAEQRRIQRVGEARVEHRQRALHDGVVVRRFVAPLRGERTCARIRIARQAQQAFALRGGQRGRVYRADRRTHAVFAWLHGRTVRDDRVVAGERGVVGCDGRYVERGQPALLRGFERDAVVDVRARRCRRGRQIAAQAGQRARPRRAVEIAEHDRAEILRVRRRGAPSKATRNAGESSDMRSVNWPGAMLSDRPVRAPALPFGEPHSGEPRRGTRMKLASASGIAASTSLPASASEPRSGARSTAARVRAG
jgi:hypothetical protein